MSCIHSHTEVCLFFVCNLRVERNPPRALEPTKIRHLRPSALSVLTRPNVLITDAHNAMMEVDSRKAREAKLITTIMDTVRGGGNVLLPTDTAGESSRETPKGTKKKERQGRYTRRQKLKLQDLLDVVFPRELNLSKIAPIFSV